MNVIPATLRHAVRNPHISGVELKVLTELHECLNIAQFRPVLSWQIENRLQVDRRSVTRALEHLVELGYLERGERKGNGSRPGVSDTFRLTTPNNGSCPPPSASAA